MYDAIMYVNWNVIMQVIMNVIMQVIMWITSLELLINRCMKTARSIHIKQHELRTVGIPGDGGVLKVDNPDNVLFLGLSSVIAWELVSVGNVAAPSLIVGGWTMPTLMGMLG